MPFRPAMGPDYRVFSPRPPPRDSALSRRSSSHRLTLPFRVSPTGPAVFGHRQKACNFRQLPLMRFLPLQRLRHPGAHSSRVYHTRFVPPSEFLLSRRFPSPETCRPYFMPTTLLGLRPSELFPRQGSVSFSEIRCPPAVTTPVFSHNYRLVRFPSG